MKVQLILCHKGQIHYAAVEVPAINVGWELYVKFETLDRPRYVIVDKVTVYAHEDVVTKAQQMLSDEPLPKICCSVRLL